MLPCRRPRVSPQGRSTSSAGSGECGAASSGPAPRARQIPKSEFTWLPEEPTYRGPAGHLLILRRRGTEPRTDGEWVESQYRGPAEHGQACPLASRCTRTPPLGRIVKRSEHDELYDALRPRMSQPEGQALYRLRKPTVERQFADLKQHRGLRPFASFGRKRARIQVGLLVLRTTGWRYSRPAVAQSQRKLRRGRRVRGRGQSKETTLSKIAILPQKLDDLSRAWSPMAGSYSAVVFGEESLKMHSK